MLCKDLACLKMPWKLTKPTFSPGKVLRTILCCLVAQPSQPGAIQFYQPMLPGNFKPTSSCGLEDNILCFWGNGRRKKIKNFSLSCKAILCPVNITLKHFGEEFAKFHEDSLHHKAQLNAGKCWKKYSTHF